MSYSEYKRRILETYQHDITAFIAGLNNKTGAGVQSNFRILWPENGFTEGMNIIPIVSYSRQKEARLLIGEISFYLNDTLEISPGDIRVTFYDDLRQFEPASSSSTPRPRFDSALGDLAWLCGEVSRIFDGLDFHGLMVTNGYTNGRGFSSGFSPRRVPDPVSGDRLLYTPTRKNISFAGQNPTAKVSLFHAAPFRYLKVASGNEFLDSAPPWYDELRQAHPAAAQEIKEKVYKKFAGSYSPEKPEKTWERVTEFLARHGHLEPACQKNQGGFKLNEYGVCLNFSCPLRMRMGSGDERCKYQSLTFSTASS